RLRSGNPGLRHRWNSGIRLKTSGLATLLRRFGELWGRTPNSFPNSECVPTIPPTVLRYAGKCMTPERWKKIESIYHAALERDSESRYAFLVEACRGDADTRRDVESLLACNRISDEALRSREFGCGRKTG